jgi:protein-tyrosine phosphatase
MDTSSFFIEKKAMFGSYPTQDTVNMLEDEGVRYFVNLTYEHEKKITEYSTKYNYISFPIPDGGIPTNKQEFVLFIYRLCSIIENLEGGDSIYIHCKGGHGRSGVVVACISAKLFCMSAANALTYTSNCHSNREIMREKWRLIGSPQTLPQRKFVISMCRTITIPIGHVLHPYYQVPIILNLDTAFDSPAKAIDHLLNKESNRLTDAIRIVMKSKIDGNPDYKKLLLDTGLQTIIFKLPELSVHVKILNELRFDYYTKMF